MFGWLTERRRKHLLETPFPPAWGDILTRNVAAYAGLADAERGRLRDLAQVFVAEKHWEGAGGLALDDEIRVTVAGTACLMLLGRGLDLFDRVVSIVVYPSAFVVPGRDTFYAERQPRHSDVVVGLANQIGTVVLAWDSSLGGARDARDGRNTVIHEFAHQIDLLDGHADGTPPLELPARRAWHDAFEHAFLAHKARAARGEPSPLRDYAITNEAEYFAVASEVFFEEPRKLRAELPEVYACMREFFGLDLAAGWPAGN